MVTRIKSSQITDGTILNADVNASAAVAATKISGLAASATTDATDAANIGSGILPLARLGSGTAGQVLKTGGAGANPSWGTLSSDFVKINSGSFSGVTAVSVDGSTNWGTYSDYKFHKILLNYRVLILISHTQDIHNLPSNGQ